MKEALKDAITRGMEHVHFLMETITENIRREDWGMAKAYCDDLGARLQKLVEDSNRLADLEEG